MRQEKKLTIDQLAALAEVGRSTVQRAQAPYQNVEIDKIHRLANALGVQFVELVGVSESELTGRDNQLGVSDDRKVEGNLSFNKRVQEQIFDLPDNLPPVKNWVGRQEELADFQDYLWDPAKKGITAFGVIGLPGIGKTVLASKLVRQLHKQRFPFAVAAWETLRPDPWTQKPPPFDKTIASLLFTLSNGQITAKVTAQDDYPRKTERLVQLLKNRMCLVVLDNIETTLQVGDAKRTGYFTMDCPEYAWMFISLIEAEHQSKIIFTSTERLAELQRPGYRSVELKGFDREEAVALLKPFDLIATERKIESLVYRYEGHPKTLELIAAYICGSSEFRGNVRAFLEHHYWRNIRSIGEVIHQVLLLLRDEERICLSRVSVYQTQEYPLTLAGFAAQMPEVDVPTLRDRIIPTLKARQLLDYDQAHESYQLHPLIQEKSYYMLRPKFGASKLECQEAHRRAYRYFSKISLQPKSEWKDSTDIKALLQAYYHACQAEDWGEAAEIIKRVVEKKKQSPISQHDWG